MFLNLPVDSVIPNPDQPRKRFDNEKLKELAESIRENGQLQPIKVRPAGDGRYMIIFGERRWRAHCLLGLETIKAEVVETGDTAMAIQAIVENLQSEDVTPLEEAHSYQAMLDTGMTVDELDKRIGLRQPWRITERTSLLALKTDYQDLLAKGHLSPSQSFEMSRLTPQNQDRLFAAIKTGECNSYNRLRATAEGFVAAEAQGSMFGDGGMEAEDAPTDEEVQKTKRLEAKVAQVCQILAGGFKNGEVVILKKINPDRAATLADEIKLIQYHLGQLEKTLRSTAAKQLALVG